MDQLPETVSEAVECLIDELPEVDKLRLSSLEEYELMDLFFPLGLQIRNNFCLWTGNEKLMQSCRDVAGEKDLYVDDASLVVIGELWKKLKIINQIRVVK
jgi:hypothetical protein